MNEQIIIGWVLYFPFLSQGVGSSENSVTQLLGTGRDLPPHTKLKTRDPHQLRISV